MSKNKKVVTKTAAPARARKRAPSAQANGTQLPPFAEVDFARNGITPSDAPPACHASPETDAKEVSPGAQAKAKLIAILQGIPEKHYSDAIQALRSHWINGLHHGFQRGFGAGWAEHCGLTGERKPRPSWEITPKECTPPDWPEAMQEDGVVDFVVCVLSLQAANGDGGIGRNRTIQLQWKTLDQAFSDGHAVGELRGRKFGVSTGALLVYGEVAA